MSLAREPRVKAKADLVGKKRGLKILIEVENKGKINWGFSETNLDTGLRVVYGKKERATVSLIREASVNN